MLCTLGLNKEEHDEQNPDRRGVFVWMLGSLRRFALGGPSSLFLASLTPLPPADTTWLCVRLAPQVSSLFFSSSCRSGRRGGDGLEP